MLFLDYKCKCGVTFGELPINIFNKYICVFRTTSVFPYREEIIHFFEVRTGTFRYTKLVRQPLVVRFSHLVQSSDRTKVFISVVWCYNCLCRQYHQNHIKYKLALKNIILRIEKHHHKCAMARGLLKPLSKFNLVVFYQTSIDLETQLLPVEPNRLMFEIECFKTT